MSFFFTRTYFRALARIVELTDISEKKNGFYNNEDNLISLLFTAALFIKTKLLYEVACTQTLYFSFRYFRKHRRARKRSERERARKEAVKTIN